jgi:replicative DNA helicase
MLRDAASSSHEDPIDTLRQLHSAAYDAAEAVAPRLTRVNMADNIDERRRRYTERQNRPNGIGLTLGISELDAHTGGLMPGELAVLGAYSKVGKTMFLVNAAAALRKAGHTPIIFTLEMGLGEIEDRIDCLFSGVSYNRFTHGKLNFDEMRQWHAAQDQLRDLGGILVESPEEGDRTVAHLINRARHAGADFVFIDQLSHMEAGKRTRDLKEHHGTVMKQLSTELSRPGKEIPCLLAVQLNRDSLDPKEEVSMKHFANAAEIEREADLLLGLSRNSEERRNRVMKMAILGARRSDIKTWMLRWDLVDRSLIEVLDEVR